MAKAEEKTVETWDRLSEYQRRAVRDSWVRWQEARRSLAKARDDLGDVSTGCSRSELKGVRSEVEKIWDDLDAALDLLDKHDAALERLSTVGK